MDEKRKTLKLVDDEGNVWVEVPKEELLEVLVRALMEPKDGKLNER